MVEAVRRADRRIDRDAVVRSGMRSSMLGFVTALAISACHGNNNDAAPQGSAAAPTVDQAVERARAEHADAQQKLEAALAEAKKAQADAELAADKFAKAEKAFDAQQAKLDAAIKMIANAKTDAERNAARARLAELQKQLAAAQAEIAATKEVADHAERAKGVHIRQECLDNPLAKGCS